MDFLSTQLLVASGGKGSEEVTSAGSEAAEGRSWVISCPLSSWEPFPPSATSGGQRVSVLYPKYLRCPEQDTVVSSGFLETGVVCLSLGTRGDQTGQLERRARPGLAGGLTGVSQTGIRGLSVQIS